jgi:hypothetical protein
MELLYCDSGVDGPSHPAARGGSVVGSFRLDSVLPAEGGILGPFYDTWQ